MKINIKKSLLMTGTILALSGCAMESSNSNNVNTDHQVNYKDEMVMNNAIFNGELEAIPEQAKLSRAEMDIDSIDTNINDRYSRTSSFNVKTEEFDKTKDILTAIKQEYKDSITVESETSEVYNDSLDKYGEPITGLEYRVLNIRLGVENDKFYSIKERFGALGKIENYYEEQVIINEDGYSDKQARISVLEEEISYLEKELLNQYSDVETKLYVRDRIMLYNQELLALKSENKDTDNISEIVSVAFSISEELNPDFIHQKTQEHNELIASREKADAIAYAKQAESRRNLENEIESITRKNIVSEINRSFAQGVNNSYNLLVDSITFLISNAPYLILGLLVFWLLRIRKERRIKKLNNITVENVTVDEEGVSELE